MYKRIAFLMIVILAALQILTACGSSDGEDANKPADNKPENDVVDTADEVVEEVVELTDDVPELDFEGYEFTILNRPQADIFYMNLFMEAEEENGEVINDAGYRRSLEVSERFNISITEIQNSNPTSTFQKSVLSGDNTYDLGMISAIDAFGLASKDVIYNMNELPYIDTAKPWWDQNAKASFSIANKIFFLPGAYELSNIDMTRILLFNKKMMQDYGISDNVYDLVLKGEWTYEKFFAMAKAVSQDINGDGQYDFNDAFGAGSTADHVVFASFLNSAAELTVRKDAGDIPYLATENERFVNVCQAIVENFHDGSFYFAPRNVPAAEDWCTNMFNEDRLLFYIITFNRIPKFRSMDADFGILPHPKFDTAQTEYYCQSGSGMVGIVPQTIDNPERTGAIWEAYTALSYKYVIPAYKEVSLKTKFARDDESSAMVDIIYDGRVYDLGREYWSSSIMDRYITLITTNSTDVTSITEKNKPAADKAIEKGIEMFRD